jgi:KDO2-lipid IV(A) lauroyltransferase
MRRHILDTPVTYYAIFLFVRYLPTRLCHWLGKVVALLIYSFSHKDREGLAFNISLALNRPANDPAVRKRVRQVFINYGRYMVDFFLMPQLSVRKAKRYFAQIQGEEILQSALARGSGAILLSPHLGNWEFGGVMLRHSEYPLAVVALAHNVSSTNTLVNRLRKEKGIKVIEVDQSPFSGVEILRHLRNNGVVAMIGDKNFFGRGLPTTFFGKEVIFPLGPVLMAMKSGAALIPAFVLKQSDGRYFGVLEEALPLLLKGEQEEITKKNVDMTARIFEEYIRRYPDQWYCPDPITGRMTS